ncbi:hypothetical protein, partial [Streptomyces sp. WAC07061]|uniref:hypothetical protein n=1 Tax=Streptomyces sp. WAC07061 TaxID=2487410 RepID=UPI001C8E638F
MDLLLKASVHLIEMRLLDRDLPIANGIRRAVDSGILRGHQGPLLTCMGDRQPYANPTALRTPVHGHDHAHRAVHLLKQPPRLLPHRRAQVLPGRRETGLQ